MNEHYYTSAPESQSRRRSFTADFRGEAYTFIYDNGVFSKGEIDEGTALLISSAQDIHGRVLDLGCGWGPVGVILARTNPQASVLMTDINERAVALAEENARINGAENARALLSDGFQNISGEFDAILTNPPIRAGKQVIYRLFDEALAHLAPEGRLYIVIRRQQGAESALKYLQKANARVVNKKKGFMIIVCGGQKDD
ncbi:MAG: class I SAM-dependent methyltransferase [Clostridia bacterium]|nr:class I SAM-dependent methyltransferase [Clostridia bacterium]